VSVCVCVYVFILVVCMSLFMSQMLIHVTIDAKQRINVGWCEVGACRLALRLGHRA
jgi:hypothetical protein